MPSALRRWTVPFSTTWPSSEPRAISIREGLKRSLSASRTEDAAYPVPTKAANVIDVPTIRAKNRYMNPPFAAAGRSPALSSADSHQPRSTIVSCSDALKRLRGAVGRFRRRLERGENVGVMLDLGNEGNEDARHRCERRAGRDGRTGNPTRTAAARPHHGTACVRHRDRHQEHQRDHHQRDNATPPIQRTILSIETPKGASTIRSRAFALIRQTAFARLRREGRSFHRSPLCRRA